MPFGLLPHSVLFSEVRPCLRAGYVEGWWSGLVLPSVFAFNPHNRSSSGSPRFVGRLLGLKTGFAVALKLLVPSRGLPMTQP